MRDSLGRWFWRTAIPPAAVLVLLLSAWQVGTSVTGVESYLFPSPLEVADAAWSRGGALLSATLLTALAAAVGFAASLLIGVTVAVAFSSSRWVRAGCYPYAVFLQTVPIVAIAPASTVGWRTSTAIAAE